MENKDKFAVIQCMKDFKLPTGGANYPALLSIPTGQRLPQLAKEDLKRTAALVTVGITSAMESMNLVRSMNADQIMDLTDAVIETSGEDNLAFEDVVLFMQKLVRGEYGSLYESMDIPKFMGKFEIYRQERHENMLSIREEQAAQYKALPINDRLTDIFPDSDERKKHTEAMIQHLIDKSKSD